MRKKKETATTPSDAIICGHCKQDSGWNRTNIAPIRGDHDLKCQQKGCGKTAVRHRSGATSLAQEPEHRKREPKEPKLPWGQRGVKKYVKKKQHEDLF